MSTHMPQQAQERIIGRIWPSPYLTRVGISVESIQHQNTEDPCMELIYRESMLLAISRKELKKPNGNILTGTKINPNQAKVISEDIIYWHDQYPINL